MSEDEAVSRRELFTGWARGLTDGLAELVIPRLERQREAHVELARRIEEALDPLQPAAPSEEPSHPWRDVLMPPADRPETSTNR